MPDSVPGIASSLLVRGKIYSLTNLAGEGAPRLHPAVAGFFEELPTDLREPFVGYCAESALVSDQFWGLDEGGSDERWTGLGDATSHFAGSLIVSVLIREEGDPEHGRTVLPCRSCMALLERLDVRVQQP